MTLSFVLLPERFAIARFDPAASVPDWATGSPLFSITRTREELSILCEDALVPEGITASRGWRCFALQGPFAFDEVGIAAGFTSVLAHARIGVLVVSTYDTDLLLVAGNHIERATAALRDAGYRVQA